MKIIISLYYAGLAIAVAKTYSWQLMLATLAVGVLVPLVPFAEFIYYAATYNTSLKNAKNAWWMNYFFEKLAFSLPRNRIDKA